MSAFGGKADIDRIAAILALRRHFGDSDVADVTALSAPAGLSRRNPVDCYLRRYLFGSSMALKSS
jgi:hypothetical protein